MRDLELNSADVQFVASSAEFGEHNERRKHPRWDTPKATARILAFTDVELKNRSESGLCIRVPPGISLTINQKIVVVIDGDRRNAIIRWLQDTDRGYQLGGCEFVS